MMNTYLNFLDHSDSKTKSIHKLISANSIQQIQPGQGALFKVENRTTRAIHTHPDTIKKSHVKLIT